MPEYRFYFLSRKNRIDGPPRELDCADDEAALIAARQLLDGQAIEIWQGKRVVGRLDPDAV